MIPESVIIFPGDRVIVGEKADLPEACDIENNYYGMFVLAAQGRYIVIDVGTGRGHNAPDVPVPADTPYDGRFWNVRKNCIIKVIRAKVNCNITASTAKQLLSKRR